ncbi:hypothetical protein PHAMO_380098 [Magnetospirillum molischianum DSM 120]|uniref:Uncharacterized protein n=1 Tax=Magnetospirillum molischianum DSM 120 TaxID=1150626 RepID=H8FVP2_MAGML|nr:hypothetical protein PHAMO_380098 [Magnetospirillum molischianum DSM 120]
MIRANRLEIDQKSDLYKGLTHNLARALAELAEIRVQRDQGRFDAVPRDTYLTEPVAATPAPGERPPDLFDLFITQKRNLTDGGKKDYATTFRYFLDYIGHERSIQSIERTDVRNWRDQLMRFPQYANTKKEFKGLSFKGVLALNDKLNQPTLDEKTINKYISTVGSFMKWAIKRGVIDNDPTHSLMLEVDDEDNKDPFTLAQLATIFSSPIWTGCAASKQAQRHLPGTVQAEDQYRWAPLIALFSGARMEEILRLTTDDLLMVDSIACMNITTTGGRSLKTRNAKRLVPVHSQLEQLGFIRMVEKRRRAGGGPVFYGMKENAQGRLSSEFSKDFSQYLDGIKVKTERLSFHSFRHNFITWAGHAGLSKASIQIIVGHTAKSVTDSYTHDGVIDLGARGRQAIVERVQYEGLDLSHLRG